jgi:hypothetical protein
MHVFLTNFYKRGKTMENIDMKERKNTPPFGYLAV